MPTSVVVPSLFLGYVLSVLSAVCNGSFAALSKLCPDIHPVHFNALLSVGTLISSLMFAFLYPFFLDESLNVELDFIACISGSLFVLANSFAFFAIPRIGIATAQGIWGGIALSVSFMWGTYGPKDLLKIPKSFALAYGGIGLILLGIVGIAQSEVISRFLTKRTCPAEDAPLLQESKDDSIKVDIENGEDGVDKWMAANQPQKERIVGLICACLCGTFGGSILVPNQIAPVKGAAAVASFGTGAIVAALISTPLYFFLSHRGTETPSFPKKWEQIWPGIMAGALWNVGNVMQIFAIPAVGFAVASSIFQCGLLVSGLLGIFAFKEITGGGRILTFLCFSFVLIAGDFILSSSY